MLLSIVDTNELELSLGNEIKGFRFWKKE